MLSESKPDFVSRFSLSPTGQLVKKILPPNIKFLLTELFYPDKTKYPIEPVTLTKEGISANFWIRNRNDRYRLEGKGFETEFAAAIIEVFKREKAPFMDVGCAQGLYSILAALTGCPVTAIDPDPLSQASLAENILLNPPCDSQIKTMAIALGDHNGPITFFIDPKGRTSSSLKKNKPVLRRSITAPMATLDSLIESNTAEPPVIIKIDVEGAEMIVLKGMTKLLKSDKKPKHIFIEIHSSFLPSFNSTPEEVIAFLNANGYQSCNSWERGSENLHHFTLVD